MIHKNVAVYIWFQLCQILTDFNNFFSAETGKMYKSGHAFTHLLWGRRQAARASDLRVARTGPACCEPRHRPVGVVCRPVSTLKADILNITYDCYSQNNNVSMATL